MSEEVARPTRRRTRLLAGAAAGVLVIGGVTTAVVTRDPYPTSAELGREGTRTFDHAPDDLPPDVVPEDALDVQGIVERRGDRWSAAVTFITARGRDDLAPGIEAAVLADGYLENYRTFDDTVLSVIYDRADGAELRVTFRDIPEGLGTALVLSGPPPS